MKKGLSSLVASMLLVAISLVAIGIVYNIFSSTSRLSPETNCALSSINPPIKILNVCSSEGLIRVTLERSLEGELTSIDIIKEGSQRAVWRCGNLCGQCTLPNAGESKIYYLQDSVASGTIQLLADSCPVSKSDIIAC